MPRRDPSTTDKLYRVARRGAWILWTWLKGPGRQWATVTAVRVAHRIRRNMVPRRVLSFPHLLVLFWMVILLWGERWVFDSKVTTCDWSNWESWPKGARPHHLVFVADPQIIDPHSYPGRPWPLSSLTVLITDNYLRRGFRALQVQLHPDSLFFLGDLFDGGREWKTRQGKFADPKWGNERPGREKKFVNKWHRKYGEDYWLREYKRFGSIFFDQWSAGGDAPGPWQRGRKLVAGLPGNHDLGFGAQIQLPVRDRFGAFFGDGNRVDVVGNHTIVSVDTVSLSADTSQLLREHDLRPIYEPANQFLNNVQAAKRKAVQAELDVWYGIDRGRRHVHDVTELATADLSRFPHSDLGDGVADLPTIMLTHVPLYRDFGTPCGPQREHWPPTKPPKGQTEPVRPDARNAITPQGGYQYQNVLNELDSVKLVEKVGNVVHVFSGDDHDYCEVVHSEAKKGVREITVKSMSMAMGIPTPGFLMVSLYHPVERDGKPVPGAPETTLQTHLCLLPNQVHTYLNYVIFVVLSLLLLAVRAFLVPVLNLTPFALEPELPGSSSHRGLPVYYKDKVEPPDAFAMPSTSSSTSSAGHRLPSRLSGTAARNTGGGLSTTASNGGGDAGRWQSSRRARQSKQWGWGGDGPRIRLDEDLYDGGKAWRTGGRQQALRTSVREMWTTTWRVAWMAALFWFWLACKG